MSGKNRHQFLSRGLVGLLFCLLLSMLPKPAQSLGESSKLSFALLDYGGGAVPYPTALRRLAWEIVKRTSIECSLDTQRLRATDAKLFRYPLLVLTGKEAVPAPTAKEAAALRRYLRYGGTLFIDSSEGGPHSAFDLSVRRFLKELFPTKALAEIPRSHVLYKSFYLLDGPAGRVRRRPLLEGIVLDGREAIIYSQNDFLGAFARDDLGTWKMEMDSRARELSFRFGVNLVMYALCLDYKDDQVHLPFILRRRKL